MKAAGTGAGAIRELQLQTKPLIELELDPELELELELDPELELELYFFLLREGGDGGGDALAVPGLAVVRVPGTPLVRQA